MLSKYKRLPDRIFQIKASHIQFWGYDMRGFVISKGSWKDVINEKAQTVQKYIIL